MNKNLILIGGGGHCKSVINVAESAGFNIIGVLDTVENVGKRILNYSVIGTDNDIPKFVDQAMFVVTVGQIKDVSLRKRLHQEVRNAGGKLATVVASTANVSKYSHIGEGTVVMHQAVVNADVRIGVGCIINTFANIEHDAVINDFCHISTGAIVNGNCSVGKNVFIGSQSVMVNGISVCDDCIIAAGTTVHMNITSKGVYSGNPASLKTKF